MRAISICFLSLALAAAGCGHSSNERHYTLHGQVIGISADRRMANIKHDAIPGFMPAMTMPYRVTDPKLLAGIAPGDLVDATLVVLQDDAYLSQVAKVGSAPLTKSEEEAAPPGAPAVAQLEPGQPVPDATFVDQDGRKRSISSFRGSTVVLTFMYTRCPLPNYCPLMDRNFAAIQKRLAGDAPLDARVHLVTISFDPDHDTPAVLKKHGEDLHADFSKWTFLTGTRQELSRFGAKLGLSVAYEDDGTITHNLRTAIIDPQGRLVKLYIGNDWTPADVLGDLKRG